MEKALDERFAAWLEENRQRILRQWMALARIPSVRGEAEDGAPYGKHCARALETAAGYFGDFHVRLETEGGYALAQMGQGEKSICLFGHSDVVPAGEDWLFTQPFQPVIQNGMLIGRGVSDNKSGIMASLCVMEMLRDCGVKLNNRLQAFIGSNEESGMADIQAFVRQERMPDICLVPDSGFPCGLGEKSILRMWAKSATPLTAVKSLKGGNAFNIVLDHVEATLSPSQKLAKELEGKLEAGIHVTVRKDGILVSAEGVAKHAAAPDGSVNAMHRLSRLLASCESLPVQDRLVFATVEAFLGSHWGEGMGIAHTDSRFGKLSAVCGMADLEDGCLKVSLDIRYGTECDPMALELRLKSAWEEAGWQIPYMVNRPGYVVEEGSPIPEMFSRIYREMSGNEKSCYYMSGGTYGRYLKNAYTVGACAISADRKPGMELPAGHGGAHQRDEAIDIEGFFLAVRILAQFVLACDRLPEEG